MELVGIVIAVIAALFVLIHARVRQLPLLTAIGWAIGTFLLLIIVLPVYLLVHGPEPKHQDEDVDGLPLSPAGRHPEPPHRPS